MISDDQATRALDALVDRIGSAIGKARADDLAGCVSRARVAARAAK